MPKLPLSGIAVLLFLLSCQPAARESANSSEEPNSDTMNVVMAVAQVDQFYAALTDRDSAGVLQRMDPQAKLYGSDASEDWSLEAIKSYMSDRQRDTTRKAVFTVRQREVRHLQGVTWVTDLVDISTIRVPFRMVTIIGPETEGSKILFAEFSALVRNEDIRAVETYYDKAALR